LSGAFHAPHNGELLRQRLVGGVINKNIKNAPPNNPLEPRVASPSDSVIWQPAPLTSTRRWSIMMRIAVGIFVATLSLAALWACSAGPPFKTPDSALAYYIESANTKSLEGINATFLEPVSEFNFTDSPPTERFRVVKRIRYTDREVSDWNQKGIIPPAAVGDVELRVEETISGKPYMFSYNFRLTADGWKIVDFVAWDDD
jgi:hypothetical protein